MSLHSVCVCVEVLSRAVMQVADVNRNMELSYTEAALEPLIPRHVPP